MSVFMAWNARQHIDTSYIKSPENQNNAVSYSDTDESNKICKLFITFTIIIRIIIFTIIIMFIVIIIIIINRVAAFADDNITLTFNYTSFNFILIFRLHFMVYLCFISFFSMVVNFFEFMTRL